MKNQRLVLVPTDAHSLSVLSDETLDNITPLLALLNKSIIRRISNSFPFDGFGYDLVVKPQSLSLQAVLPFKVRFSAINEDSSRQ